MSILGEPNFRKELCIPNIYTPLTPQIYVGAINSFLFWWREERNQLPYKQISFIFTFSHLDVTHFSYFNALIFFFPQFKIFHANTLNLV